jgi:hypothetical protein
MRSTTIVRKLMQQYRNKNYGVWTNKYDTCRTVKCYGIDDKMIAAITNALNAKNIPHTIKTGDSRVTWHDHPRTIVRLDIDY